MATVAPGGLLDQARGLHAGRVDRYLVGPRVEQTPHVLDPAHAASDRQWNEDLTRDRFDHIRQDVALIGARRDIEKCQLVGAFGVVALSDLHRIARIAQIDEIDALDDPPGRHVQARNDALSEHRGAADQGPQACASRHSLGVLAIGPFQGGSEVQRALV